MRAQAVELADQIGAVTAAERYGVKPATIRAWRARLRAHPPPAVDALPVPVGDADDLRLQAQQAREAALAARQQAQKMIANGRAAESRNAAITAQIWTSEAAALEQAVREREAHSVRMREAELTLLENVTDRFFAALGVPNAFLDDGPLGRLFGAALDAAISDGELNRATVEAARDALLDHARAQVRRELHAEAQRVAQDAAIRSDYQESEPTPAATPSTPTVAAAVSRNAPDPEPAPNARRAGVRPARVSRHHIPRHWGLS